MLPREVGQGRDAAHQAMAHEFQRGALEDQVGVVGDESAGRTQVDEAPGGRRFVAVEVNVRHHVVAETPLVLGRAVRIDRAVGGGTELRQRSFRDVESEFALRLGKRQPQAPPRSVAALRREDCLHFA